MNFWNKLNKPFFVLAPMDDVTDSVFRQIVAQAAPPDVYMTEFASVDGLLSAGSRTVGMKLETAQNEPGPLVAQIWGTDPAKFRRVAEILAQSGRFAGIDINMGCPVKAVVKKGACSALINTPELAAEIIQATKAGAGNLPVSVKTRLGFNAVITEDWIGFLLKQDIAALTIHGRTAKEQSKVPAHWDEIATAVELRDRLAPNTIVIGNGDVTDRKQGIEYAHKYGVDGVMIGRGIFQDLFAFDESPTEHSQSEMISRLLDHIVLHEAIWGNRKNLESLKKFAKVYITGFAGASQLREQLMRTKTADEMRAVLEPYAIMATNA